MNRLRVRLSLAFIGVVILVGVLPVAITVTLRYAGLIEPSQAQELFETLPQDVLVRLQTIAEQLFPRQLLRLLLTAVVVGIAAGILMSRQLTAPLHKLAEAARAIGSQDLSRRVAVEGTEEIEALARAFNQMAADLEAAETQRQQLLADVAHELRTPLSVLQGNLRALLDDVYPLEKGEVARLYDQTRHLSRLVRDLHDLAQAEVDALPLNFRGVDVVELVQTTTGLFAPLAEEADVALTVDTPAGLPLVRADAARLTQALQNLLANALHHTPAGGTITVQVARDDNNVHLAVTDTGRGIHQDHLPHVFDRFYRTDHARSRDTGGTGLGLAIVHAIAEAHGGTATATSAGEGQGSQFTITLPLLAQVH